MIWLQMKCWRGFSFVWSTWNPKSQIQCILQIFQVNFSGFLAMDSQEVYDVSDKTRYTFKKHPFVSFLDDSIGAFSKVLENVLHVEDIHSYIHWKIKSIRDVEIHKEIEKMCNKDLTLKPKYMRLNELNLVKYMFYTKLNNHEWTRIILSRVHDDQLWLGDA